MMTTMMCRAGFSVRGAAIVKQAELAGMHHGSSESIHSSRVSQSESKLQNF
jgi:hypothetical protein